MSGGWSPISTVPRDGTPVILWMAEDDVPPVLPLTVGYWTVNPKAGLGYCPRQVSAIGGSLEIHRIFALTGKSADGSRFFAIEKIIA